MRHSRSRSGPVCVDSHRQQAAESSKAAARQTLSHKHAIPFSHCVSMRPPSTHRLLNGNLIHQQARKQATMGGGKVIEIQSKAEWDAQLAGAGDKAVIVDFSAVWCGPCQMIGPVFVKLSDEYANIVFLKVDVDANAVRRSGAAAEAARLPHRRALRRSKQAGLLLTFPSPLSPASISPPRPHPFPPSTSPAPPACRRSPPRAASARCRRSRSSRTAPRSTSLSARARTSSRRSATSTPKGIKESAQPELGTARGAAAPRHLHSVSGFLHTRRRTVLHVLATVAHPRILP